MYNMVNKISQFTIYYVVLFDSMCKNKIESNTKDSKVIVFQPSALVQLTF